MLAVLLAIATAAPSPSPEPLRTIVTVRTSPFCGAFATHVNSAISYAVDNDKNLGSVIMTLHSNDLANTVITRNNELHQLQSLADSMYHSYRDGEAEVNRLRDLAKTAKDKDEQEEIKSSADALGGVLYRQHLIQRDIDGFVAYMDAADMRRDSDPELAQNDSILGAQDTYAPSARTIAQPYYWVPTNLGRSSSDPSALPMAGDESLSDDVAMAAAASDDFKQRIPAIFQDELTAGDRIAQANERC
jgi:hypothetical protein